MSFDNSLCRRLAVLLAGVLLWAPVAGENGGGDEGRNGRPQAERQALSVRENAVKKAIEESPVPTAGDSEAIRRELKAFYESRDYRPAWIEAGRIRPQLESLENILGEAEQHGLDPADYSWTQLKQRSGDARQGESGAPASAELDMLASSAAIAYIRDLSGGRFSPQQLAKHVQITVDLQTQAADASQVLAQALEEGLEERLARLAPVHAQYRWLKELLKTLRKQPQLPAFQVDGIIEKGDRHPVLVTVRKILNHKCHECSSLTLTGDSADLMNEGLVRAVKDFQAQSAIRQDGIIGPETIEMLNLGVEQQIERVRLNLDRWRWYSGRLEPPYILVNVPEYRLRYYHANGAKPLPMDIVVGTTYDPTPIFSDTVEYAVLRPYWLVPFSIATQEMLPKIREDIGYLKEERIQVFRNEELIDPRSIDWNRMTPARFDVRFRQRPGPENAMGLIKFMFPNEHAIYLHDTPADQLFDRERRDFSHGCIRLEKPFQLARELLPSEVAVDRQSILQNPRNARRVDLRQPVPVHLAYFTVVVDDRGRERFLNDLYAIDAASEKALEDARHRQR